MLFTVYLFMLFTVYLLIFLYTVKSDAIAYTGAHFGQGTGPILLDNVACTGAEYNLTSCRYDADTSDCRHYEDAGVRCNTTCGYSVMCVVISLSKRMSHKVSMKFVQLLSEPLDVFCKMQRYLISFSSGKSSWVRLWVKGYFLL